MLNLDRGYGSGKLEPLDACGQLNIFASFKMVAEIDFAQHFLQQQDSRLFVYDTLEKGLELFLEGAPEEEYQELVQKVSLKFQDISMSVEIADLDSRNNT